MPTRFAITLLLMSTSTAIGQQAARYAHDKRPDLPPLMEFVSGQTVQTKQDWARRKSEIRRLLCEHVIGFYPKHTPKITKAETVLEKRADDGSIRRRVKLTFDTSNAATCMLDVWIPQGAEPRPILLTQPRYYQIPWAKEALSRGYLVCLYPGVDSHHHEKDYPGYESVWETFQAAYPDATWTEISTKAWLASRALDYLLDPDNGYHADGNVGIIGHSRYGKQSMIAAAFDERITAVVARSPGTPASCSYRFASRTTFSEAPCDFPGTWFLPSLKTYVGRENELPIDAHGWLALIAPRRCMIHTAHHDDCDPTFGVERSYLQGRQVYAFLGRPDNLRVCYRPGGHNPITQEHLEHNLDWFDLSFGRGDAKQNDFPERFLHRFDWQAWKANLTRADLKPPFDSPRSSGRPEDARARIRWTLGQPPNDLNAFTGEHTFLTDAESAMMNHDRWKIADTARLPVSFGDNVRGNVYHNPSVKQPAPAVIWLHPYSYPSGYNEAYGVMDTTIYHRLAREGFVVLAYDQVGFGLRLVEGSAFYERHPTWSRLGRMVYDVRQAVDFLAGGKGAAKGTLPPVRKDHIFVVGYSMGGMVGLLATALDDRIAGAVSFCGFTPLRTDTDAKLTGGIRRLWELHALQPLLGLFHGREQEIPYDFDDVLTLIAPRPCLVVSPKRDRHADVGDVIRCVEAAKGAWKPRGAERNLVHLVPDDINRFQAPQQKVALDWLKKTIAAMKD